MWSYINPFMLYGRHLGYKGNFEQALAAHDAKALELFHKMEEVKQEAAQFMKVRAVWQFFEAERDGNAIHLFGPAAAHRSTRSTSAASAKDDGLCLSDYILEPTTAAATISRCSSSPPASAFASVSEQWKQAGEFFKAHAMQALAIETAEGTAEWLHRRIREDWGFPDPPAMTMQDRFTSQLSRQAVQLRLSGLSRISKTRRHLEAAAADEIGVQLTEGIMMEPEASVSALVFHHPDCAYFTAE